MNCLAIGNGSSSSSYVIWQFRAQNQFDLFADTNSMGVLYVRIPSDWIDFILEILYGQFGTFVRT